MHYREKLLQLRGLFKHYNIQGYLQPVHDSFLSEYPPACFQRVQWLCGFSGSAGMLLILEDRALLFVDGRYSLQAVNQLDPSLFEILNSGETSAEQWLERQAAALRIGYDPDLFTPDLLAKLEKSCEPLAIPNPVDAIWKDRPAMPASPIFLHDERWTGESSESKCQRLAAELKEKKQDAALISDPESLCWLLNIRARDVEHTPLALLRGILFANGNVQLAVDASRLPPLPAHIHAVASLDATALSGEKLRYDRSKTPCSLMQILKNAGAELVAGEDPCLLPKACKNPTEVAAIRDAHAQDGRALTRLLHWIKTHPDIESVSEMDIAEMLLTFRKQSPDFLEPSFPTIAGSGPHGAIVHYRADASSNRHLKKGELLLLDSGGQYYGGTTDVTRTIAIGQPSAEHQDRFTRVLKGHIALATAVFPKGTRGSQLDCLARQFLWQAGLDYDHGTGHGVGQFLSVHEGPQRISKRGNDAALQVGMILSNEPGYYAPHAYGIRIENLVVVIEKPNGFLGFETLTRVPLDMRLVNHSMLTEAEREWLTHYQTWSENA